MKDDECWMMKDEDWMMKLEGWIMKDEGFKLLRGFADRQTDEWTEVFCSAHYFCLTTRHLKFPLPPSKTHKSGQNYSTEMFHPISESWDQEELDGTWARVLGTS